MNFELPKKVGLLFGTFDPIHNGHVHLAKQMIKHTDIEMVLLLVTPHSPFKIGKKISSYEHRYNMVEIALKDYSDINPCEYEKFNTPPYYSITTLNKLKSDYPDVDFVYIMGSDNAVKLNMWQGIDVLMDNFSFYVFKREPFSNKEVTDVIHSLKNGHKNKLVDIEPYNISSTQIRNGVSTGNESGINSHLPNGVRKYIEDSCLYTDNSVSL